MVLSFNSGGNVAEGTTKADLPEGATNYVTVEEKISHYKGVSYF